ncbi:DUF1906 domain-containing protein [Paenibacillus sp. MBLB4367]|uniref:DUF1906 domain-containing protein n=1 Tax=Paenibacillus sp. MBLB4367 TaxID=3384767 RepID=UPI003908049D
MAKGFDCATPLNANLAMRFKEEGYEFVCRYLVPSGWKRLTGEEADAISKAGMQIVSVFETTADRALGGRAAGLADGAFAAQTAHAVGQPEGSAIYFAVDFDVTNQVQMKCVIEYIHAASEATPNYTTGVYGEYEVIEAVSAAGVCSRFWQTRAWSGGKRSGTANIYQYDCGPQGLGMEKNGIMVDLNESYGNEGWWNANPEELNEEEEDGDNMPMKLKQWQWDMLYEVMGKAYNADQLDWDWMQKIVDKTLTAAELSFLNTVLDGRIDRNIEV